MLKSLLPDLNHKQNVSLKLPRGCQMYFIRGLTVMNFLRIFGTRSIKTRKNWPIFSSFNPFPSMPSVATGDRKQFEYRQIVFNNKTRFETRSLVLEFN